jgi:hypothetical protein
MVGGVGNSFFIPTHNSRSGQEEGWVGGNSFSPSPITAAVIRRRDSDCAVGNSFFHPLPVATQWSGGGVKGGGWDGKQFVSSITCSKHRGQEDG